MAERLSAKVAVAAQALNSIFRRENITYSHKGNGLFHVKASDEFTQTKLRYLVEAFANARPSVNTALVKFEGRPDFTHQVILTKKEEEE